MSYKIIDTKKSDTNVEIDVSIEWADFAKFEKSIIDNLCKTMSIDGFRKGHIPESVIKDKVSQAELLYLMSEDAINSNYRKIILETNLDVVGNPAISITKIAEGNPLEFKITVDILPEIKLPNIEKIRKEAKIEKAEEAKPEEIDMVMKEITEGYKKDGKDEAEMLKTFNLTTMDELRENVKNNLTKEKEIDNKSKHRAMLLEEVVKQTETKLPASLIEFEIDYLVNDMKNRVSSFGLKFEDYLKNLNKTEADMRADFKSDAEKRAKLEIILREIAKQNKLEIDAHRLFHIKEDLKAHYKDWKDEEIDFYAKSMAEKDMAILFITGEKQEPLDHEDHHH